MTVRGDWHSDCKALLNAVQFQRWGRGESLSSVNWNKIFERKMDLLPIVPSVETPEQTVNAILIQAKRRRPAVAGAVPVR